MLAGVSQGLARASRVGESGNAQRCVGLRRILVWFGASGDREREKKKKRDAVAVVGARLLVLVLLLASHCYGLLLSLSGISSPIPVPPMQQHGWISAR